QQNRNLFVEPFSSHRIATHKQSPFLRAKNVFDIFLQQATCFKNSFFPKLTSRILQLSVVPDSKHFH
ncbi:MAG: hypothetical protein ACI4QL_02900, partial [Candidatus Fimimonas sp.]